MSSLERRILQDNSLKNIYNYMQIDHAKPANSKEKFKHIYNKFLSQKRRYINYRREKMTDLYNKEEEIYKKELKEKSKGIIEDKPIIQEEYKVHNINDYPSESFPIEKHRFDNRRIPSSNKKDQHRINDDYAKEVLSNFKYEKNMEMENSNYKNYENDFNKDRNERIKLDDEIMKYHRQLEYLKQEEIIKRKKYQDNLLQQINEKIQNQMKNLNNKYTENNENHITFYK